MLDFCAEHGIAAEIEVITADQIDEAYDRVFASDVRYRFVIDTGSLATPKSRRRPVPANGQPAAASLAATRLMFSGPPSWWATPSMNFSISSWSICVPWRRLRLLFGDLSHDLFDLVFGERGVAKQRQQRHPVGAGHTAGVTGTEPVDDLLDERGRSHAEQCRRPGRRRHYRPHSLSLVHCALTA